ncbi:hypothetical protein ACOBR2_03170 [Telmatobacter bradus]|uniref:hypothetical protein n=1 Tax=Telmatobacter bradus TaxID=474953 RepID=UPI003B42E827
MSRVLALGLVAMVPVALTAQAKSTAKTPASDSPSKWDIFAGYSYLAPKGTVTTTNPAGTSVTASYDAVNVGGLFSGAYFFNKYVGAQVEFGEHEWGTQRANSNVGTHSNDDGFLTAQAGLIARFPAGDITPFVHALVGGAYVGGPYYNPNTWGPAITVGGGLDYKTPLFGGRLGVRLFQFDYEYMHADFGPQTQTYGGRANINAARLSTGIVYHIGSVTPPPPVTLAVAAVPTSVYAGEPITVTATPGNVLPKLNSVYVWSGDGVKGNGATATVDSASLAPGTYTVKSEIKEGKPGKEGLKPGQSATATTTFTVKPFEPPTISCSTAPSTIKPGDTATITAVAVSPQNRPLTYSYSATAGSIAGSGTTATYTSAGAPTGVAGITCTVADDKGHSTSANTDVTIVAPVVPSPKTQALCSISFTKDAKRPTRVDNEAKACLDEVALDLQRSADAKAVVVGEADAKEKAKTAKEAAFATKHKKAKVEDLASQRAVNTKQYLVADKGIDASRISTSTGTTDDKTVENYLVPAGASFDNDVKGTTPADASKTKAEVRKPLGEKKHHKKAAK